MSYYTTASWNLLEQMVVAKLKEVSGFNMRPPGLQLVFLVYKVQFVGWSVLV